MGYAEEVRQAWCSIQLSYAAIAAAVGFEPTTSRSTVDECLSVTAAQPLGHGENWSGTPRSDSRSRSNAESALTN